MRTAPVGEVCAFAMCDAADSAAATAAKCKKLRRGSFITILPNVAGTNSAEPLLARPKDMEHRRKGISAKAIPNRSCRDHSIFRLAFHTTSLHFAYSVLSQAENSSDRKSTRLNSSHV